MHFKYLGCENFDVLLMQKISYSFSFYYTIIDV